jgi:hypothetical protein
MQAIEYYSVNLTKIVDVLNQLEETEADSIVRAKDAASSSEATGQIVLITTNYGALCDSIKALEKRGLDIRTAMNIYDGTVNAVTSVQGAKARGIAQKALDVTSKNEGLAQMHEAARVIFDGEALDARDSKLMRYTPEELACLKFSPLTSCDVERSFSMLQDVYRDNRACFTTGHSSKHMLVHYNSGLTVIGISPG